MRSERGGRRDGGTRILLSRLGSEGERGGSGVSSEEVDEEGKGSRTFPLYRSKMRCSFPEEDLRGLEIIRSERSLYSSVFVSLDLREESLVRIREMRERW